MAGYFNLQHPTFEGWVCETVDLILRSSRKLFICGLLHQHGPQIAQHLLSGQVGSSYISIIQRFIRYLPILEIFTGPLIARASGGAIPSVLAPEYIPCVDSSLEQRMKCAISISAFLLGKYMDTPLRKIHPWLPTAALSLCAGYNILRPFIPGKTITDLIIDMVYQRAILPSRRSLREHREHMSSSFLGGRSKVPLFHYNSLASGSVIRLVQLEANQGGVVCHLVEADLSESPHYDAVSYCWGSGDKPHTLAVNELGLKSYIPITESAWQALRDCAPLQGTRYLWIDSICINQDDEDEKCHQITLMNRIYSSAQEVIIHLGDERDADTAVSFVNRLYFHYNFKDSEVLKRVIGPNEFDFKGLLRRQQPTSLNDAHAWEAWEKLIKNQYWQRVWIIQECAVAQRLVVVYGGILVAWFLLPFSAAIFSGISAELALRSDISAVRNLTASAAQDAIISLMHLRLIYEKRDVAQSIWELAVIARNSKSTQPQDKVFGLLGMSRQAEEASLQPDSRKSLCEIYGSVVGAGLKGGSFLTFCISGLSLRKNDNLPSWIPDLANPPSTDTKRYHERSEHKTLEGSELPFEISPDWEQLKIRGAVVGIIAVKTSDPDETLSIDALRLPAPEAIQQGFRRMLRFVDMRYFFDDHIPHEDMTEPERTYAFWHTITDGFDGKAPRPETEQTELLHALEQTFFQISQACENSRQLMEGDSLDQITLEQIVSNLASRGPVPIDTQSARLGELVTGVLSQIAETDEFKGILEAEIMMGVNTASTLILAITEDKKVAVAPVGTQPNDVIVLFDGSPVPHILRPKEGRDGLHELVGEAYVYGITEFQATDAPRSWFILC